ncbi:hypothetical protein PF005_g2425 [Phytophthora fragariae]|uniref:Uncharacterized protein n=1 Tax=Phytophthora fragariae TaxID=53985 RepID=A0A6A3E7Y8_9STRA|nr:hypothetical protein PF003_g8517 [Phytophthora fragariae]KAE8928447.1 hypothetical protein PF009_g21412 [Phytophthora fragariae]KAE8987785.1 hypothetical protein PF011_g19433 [Phytophthora fragariae]KAE9135598.1 hypothetical protein PF010_g2006 [Phytophthora fragariae]KAE9154086.1 hypothetical protein PF006_g1852 [Phytophthora fragariae]
MVLRWNETGNHFQAVHYPQELHSHYAETIATLDNVRNDIQLEHGWKALDAIAYDEDVTAKDAAQVIKAVRRAIKEAKEVKLRMHGSIRSALQQEAAGQARVEGEGRLKMTADTESRLQDQAHLSPEKHSRTSSFGQTKRTPEVASSEGEVRITEAAPGKLPREAGTESNPERTAETPGLVAGAAPTTGKTTSSLQRRMDESGKGLFNSMSSLPREIAGVGANKTTNKNKKGNGQGSINDYFRVQTTDE